MRGLALAVAGMVAASCAQAQTIDDAVRRFASSFLPYAPGAAIDVRVDHNGVTGAGPYLALTALRTVSGKDKSSEQLGMLVDPMTRTVTAGLMFPLPPGGPPVTPEELPAYVRDVLPQVLTEMMTSRVKVRWPGGPLRTAAVTAFAADVSTGFGWSALPIAISADARYLAVGSTWNLDRDVRVARRELLESAQIQWDPGHEAAVVKVVEFSDYQCPACKRGWADVKPVLAELGDKVQHGLVNFPLYRNHPWAFRAAVAGTCVGSLWADQLLNFKEEMYRLQDSLTVGTVDDAVFGFLTQRQLEEKRFRDCYLKDPSVDAVLRQMEVGQRLGVLGTPAYFANGEALPFGNKEWVSKRLQAILAAGGKPEAAAEVQ